MKKVIYTSLVGKYDELKQPAVIDSGFDYICFSNDIRDSRIGIWLIKPIPVEDIKDNIRLSRYAKILPHRVIPEYDFSIYMDANIQITGKEIYDVINQRIEEQCLICHVPHPTSNCIYDEIRTAYYAGVVNLFTAKKQYNHLLTHNFPSHFGLYENNIILRRHNDSQVVKISEDWWMEYANFSQRDQFSLMYVYWIHGTKPNFLIDSNHNTRNVPYLKYITHSKRTALNKCVNTVSRNNVFRRIGRYLHTCIKKTLIQLYLSKGS